MSNSLSAWLQTAESGVLATGAGPAETAHSALLVDPITDRPAPTNLAATLDHTILRPEATWDEVRAFSELGERLAVASVCVQPTWIRRLRSAFPNLTLCTVLGFPHGANSPRAKAYEARVAVEDGADELDLVLSIGRLRAGEHAFVYDEIARVREATPDRTLKIILETALLTPAEIVRGTGIAKAAGADFVKTSTGYAPAGATLENIRLMRRTLAWDDPGNTVRLKASGGIRDRATALAFFAAGADRIGTSSTEKILQGEPRK